MKRRLYFLSSLLPLLAVACSDGATGPATAEFMQRTGGDDQEGPPGAVLSTPLEVKVSAASGSAIAGFTVSFSTTGGSVSPQSMDTDAQGLARTTLTLPQQEGTVTVTAVAAGLPAVSFTARVLADPLQISDGFLPAARRGLPYARKLTATGGAPPHTFAVTSGALPPGLTLESDGTFVGTATENGAFSLSVRLTDDQGAEQTRQFTLQVCDVPEPMAVGEVRVSDPTSRGACGIFLPVGSFGDRYRVGFIRTTNQPNISDFRNVSVFVRGNGVSTVAAPPPALRAPAAARPLAAPELRRWADRLEATTREHVRLLEEGEALTRRLGTEALLRERPAALRAEGAQALPEKLQVTTAAQCNATSRVTVLRVAENDHLALYQDSAQNANPDTRVTSQQANRLLNLYRSYGHPILEGYFGGVSDLDGNGKVIVVVTPAIGEQVLGRVYSGDFFTRQQCPGSNEGEYVYLSVDIVSSILDEDLQIGLYVLVHEMKHVSSLYQRILNQRDAGGQDYHPVWREEGGAEIAGERAARYAWYFLGGPPMNVAVTEQLLRSPNDPGHHLRTENIALYFMLQGTQHYLARQPNSIVVRPQGAPLDYEYGSGWLFQRWLGDAYGGADGGDALADSAFFRQLNHWTTPQGVAGVEAVTGRSWTQLMEEFAAAAMANGRVAVPRSFTSYNFVTAIEMWCFAVPPAHYAQSGCPSSQQPGPPGAFPWPVTSDSQGVSQTRSFADAVFEGQAGPSGLRVHDFVSNGTGYGAEVNVEFVGASRVVVVRIN